MVAKLNFQRKTLSLFLFVVCASLSTSDAQSIVTPTAGTSYGSTVDVSVFGYTGQASAAFVLEVRCPGPTGNVMGTVSGISLADKSFSATIPAPIDGWTGPGGANTGTVILYCKDANGNDVTVQRNINFF